MKNEFLTIKEAAAKYQKGSSTITRFVREHQKTKFVKKEKGRFLVSDSLLSSNFEKVEVKEIIGADHAPAKEKENDNSLVVDTLKSENEFLRSQIVLKDVQLNERNSQIETHEHLEIQTSTEPKKEKEKIGSELAQTLKSENEFLKTEIGNKQRTIDTLLERQFEQNTIIQTLQSRIDGIGNKIDNSVLLLSEKVKENKQVAPGPLQEKGNDNGFTIASSVMIILLVIMIIVFLIV